MFLNTFNIHIYDTAISFFDVKYHTHDTIHNEITHTHTNNVTYIQEETIKSYIHIIQVQNYTKTVKYLFTSYIHLFLGRLQDSYHNIYDKCINRELWDESFGNRKEKEKTQVEILELQGERN